MSNLPLTARPSTTDPAGAPGPTDAVPHRVRARRAAAGLGAAALAGLLVWLLAVPLAGLPLEVAAAGRTVGPLSVLASAFLTGAAAWLLLSLLSRFPRGPAVWTGLGLAVLLLSLAGPPLSGATGNVLLVLELMHLVVGGVLILGLRRSLAVPQSRGTGPRTA
jgi:hypothetical protein